MTDNLLDRAPVEETLSEGLRRCAICKVEKVRSDFQSSKSGYIRSYCRPCDSSRDKAKRAARTPEQMKQTADYTKAYHAGLIPHRKTKAEKMGIANEPGNMKVVNSSPMAKRYHKRYYGQNKTKAWRNQLKIKFKITAEQYECIHKSHGGVCAICHMSESLVAPDGTLRRLSVDHDHLCCKGLRSCGKCIRGLLCSSCNFAIGHLADDEARIMDALAYVRKWKR